MKPQREPTLMILPDRRAIIPRPTAWLSRNEPVRLVGQRVVPHLERHLLGAHHFAEAGIVDQDVDRAEAGGRRVGDAGDGDRIAQVGAMEGGAGGQVLGIDDVDGQHARAQRREIRDQHRADPAGRTGDDGGLIANGEEFLRIDRHGFASLLGKPHRHHGGSGEPAGNAADCPSKAARRVTAGG